MAYQFPAFNFSQILLWKDSEPPGCEEGFRDDAELLGLGLMSAVGLASGTRGRPGRKWALNFARPLTVGEVEAAIARVRGLTTRPIYEIGPTPLPVLPSFSVSRVAAWTADQARTGGVKAVLAAPAREHRDVIDKGGRARAEAEESVHFLADGFIVGAFAVEKLRPIDFGQLRTAA